MVDYRGNRLITLGIAAGLLMFFLYGLTILRMWSDRNWVHGAALRILFVDRSTGRAALLSVWDSIQEPQLIDIPGDIYFSAVGGYGNLTIQGLATMGKTEELGMRLTQNTMEMVFASQIQLVREQSATEKNLNRIKTDVLTEGLMGKRSLAEAVEIRALLNKVRWNTIKPVELGDSTGVMKRKELDGTTQKYMDPVMFTAFLERTQKTLWPEAAEIQVAVINLSNMSQMAANWSRLVKMAGFDLVNVGDEPQRENHTRLIYANKDMVHSPAGKSLASLFPLAEVSVGDTAKYRADVVLLVGLDSWQWLNQRASYLELVKSMN